MSHEHLLHPCGTSPIDSIDICKTNIRGCSRSFTAQRFLLRTRQRKQKLFEMPGACSNPFLLVQTVCEAGKPMGINVEYKVRHFFCRLSHPSPPASHYINARCLLHAPQTIFVQCHIQRQKQRVFSRLESSGIAFYVPDDEDPEFNHIDLKRP